MTINVNFFSPNFSNRNKAIEYIILHYTEMIFEEALSRLCDKKSEVSAHYLIKEDGEIFQLVKDENIAWHAGKSSWHNQEKLNQNSIGIELDNLGNKKFDERQIKSCIKLCTYLTKKYQIKKNNIIGHSDVAPDRKIDPGIFFDWKVLHKNGFGIWHNIEMTDNNEILHHFGSNSAYIKTLQKKLKNIGYNIQITGKFDMQTNYVIRAFQAKFYPSLIQKSGLSFYKDQSSKYFWDLHSDNILNSLK